MKIFHLENLESQLCKYLLLQPSASPEVHPSKHFPLGPVQGHKVAAYPTTIMLPQGPNQ